MALKNQAIIVEYYAWDTVNQVGKTGDVANHTLRLVQDGGTPATPGNSPAEVDATNCPGLYKLSLTAGEMNFNWVTLHGKSSTANIVITPVQIPTERGALPAVAAGATGGLPLVDANGAVKLQSGTGANQISLSSGAVILQAGTGTGQLDFTTGQVKVQSGTGSGQLDVTSGQVKVQSGTGAGQLNATSGVVQANVTQINSVAASAAALERSASTILPGTATGTPTTTTMATSTTAFSTTDSFYNGRLIVWTSGVLLGQMTNISGYTGSSRTFAFTAVTNAPASGDTFVVV